MLLPPPISPPISPPPISPPPEEEKGDGEGKGEAPSSPSPSDNPFLRAAIAASEERASSSCSSPDSITVADVPGLLPGAGSARGTGLGHEFLRHVSRCSAIAVVVDASGSLALKQTPREQFEGIVSELRAYDEVSAARRGGYKSKKKREWWEEEEGREGRESDSSGLAAATRNAVIIANKCDLASDGGLAAVEELREAVRSERRTRKGEKEEAKKNNGDGQKDTNEEEEEVEQELIVVVAASGKTGAGIADVALALRAAVRASETKNGKRG